MCACLASARARGTGKDRKAIWSVFEQYRALLRTHNLMEPDEIMACAAQLIEKTGARSYASVIVDETQSFSMPALRLVLRAVGKPLRRQPARLADFGRRRPSAHLRASRAILNKCGINVRGRSAKLYLNYRSTEHIRRLAVALLMGFRSTISMARAITTRATIRSWSEPNRR